MDNSIYLVKWLKQLINLTINFSIPTITNLQINKDKIREVIGKGGAVIREISETTGAKIEINDEGLSDIAAVIKNLEMMH